MKALLQYLAQQLVFITLDRYVLPGGSLVSS
jgi:hypothetical protein